jgi:hypothetical protein
MRMKRRGNGWAEVHRLAAYCTRCLPILRERYPIFAVTPSIGMALAVEHGTPVHALNRRGGQAQVGSSPCTRRTAAHPARPCDRGP